MAQVRSKQPSVQYVRAAGGSVMPKPRSDIVRPRYRGAIGVLRAANRYLLVQRSEGLAKGGAWCFPGGHIECGENSRAAIVRELWEELGIRIVPMHRLGAVRVPDAKYVLATWLIDYDGAPLQPNTAEVTDTKWLTIDEIRQHPRGLPTNEHVLRMLEELPG